MSTFQSSFYMHWSKRFRTRVTPLNPGFVLFGYFCDVQDCLRMNWFDWIWINLVLHFNNFSVLPDRQIEIKQRSEWIVCHGLINTSIEWWSFTHRQILCAMETRYTCGKLSANPGIELRELTSYSSFKTTNLRQKIDLLDIIVPNMHAPWEEMVII